MEYKILIVFDSLDGELRYSITGDREWLPLNGVYINSCYSPEDLQDLLNEKLSKIHDANGWKPLIEMKETNGINQVISVGFLP